MSKYPVIDMAATGKHIRQLMKDHGISAKQLAEELSVTSQSACYRWLNGDNMPSIDNLVVMAKIFRCSIDDLIITEGGE